MLHQEVKPTGPPTDPFALDAAPIHESPREPDMLGMPQVEELTEAEEAAAAKRHRGTLLPRELGGVALLTHQSGAASSSQHV